MDPLKLHSIVNDIAEQYVNAKTPGYFDCLEALDSLEFYILDYLDQTTTASEIAIIRNEALQLHSRLSAIAQNSVDSLIEGIRAKQFTPQDLKQLFNQYAQRLSNDLSNDKPDFDLFDDFLNQLFQVNFEPSETYRRTQEMLYLQPTPGRIILEMINELPFTDADCFYDLGSGLGYVSMLVSLLTGTHAVGVEYEPTYAHYAQCAAQKLDIESVAFRNMDVQDAYFENGTIFFMYTPFTGSILRNVLDRLQVLSQERQITVCTYGPCTPVIEREKWLCPVRDSHGEIYRLAIFKSAGPQ